MTEKRFELSKSDIKDFRIYDYGKEDAYFIGCDEHTGICLVSLLNQLNEENEQLRTALKELKEIGDYQADRIQELSDENKQLEQQLQSIFKLTKKIEDCTHDIKVIGDVE